ncbi:MAG: hypothetical protein R3Y04_08575 [Rikenellaceae bacterium]
MNLIPLIAIFAAIVAIYSKKNGFKIGEDEPDVPMSDLDKTFDSMECTEPPRIEQERQEEQLEQVNKPTATPPLLTSQYQSSINTPPPTISSDNVASDEPITQSSNPILEDFDLDKAIIYSEIITPKWKEYE